MAMRTPVVEPPIKAPEVEPTVGEVRFGLKIPSREGEVKEMEEGTRALTGGLKEAMSEWEKQAEFAVKNQYDARLADLKTNILGRARTYQGIDSFEVAPQAQDDFKKGAAEIGKDITDQRQKDAFSLMTQGYARDLNEEVNKHVASQIPVVYKKSIDDFLDAKSNEAAQSHDDPAKIESIMGDVKKMRASDTEYTHRNPEMHDMANKLDAQKIVDAVITAKRNASDATGASKFLQDAFDKGEITADYFKRAQKQIEPSVVNNVAINEWKTNILGHKEFMDPGGTVNKAAVENYIFNKYNDKTDRSFAVQREIKTLMQDYNKNWGRGKQNNDELYYNFFLSEKKKRESGDPNALSYDQTLAMRTDPRFGSCDEVDSERRRIHAVAYENNKGSKPAILVRLHEGILDGTTTQSMIDMALKVGDLGPADAQKLESAMNTHESGKNPAYNAQWNQIRKTTEGWFGKGTDAYNSFMADFYEGEDPGESVKDLKARYQKAVEQHVKGGLVQRIFNPKPVDKVAEDEFKSRVGEDIFNMMKAQTPKQYGGDVIMEKKDIEKEYGEDCFDEGQPVYNAINSILIRNKQPGNEEKKWAITKKTIDYVMRLSQGSGNWSER